MPVIAKETPAPVGGKVIVIVPVGILHVGWVVTVAVGADGEAGTALITTFAEATEVHPVAVSVTVKL